MTGEREQNDSKGQTNSVKGSIFRVPYEKEVRIIAWGGTKIKSHYNTFYHTKNRVIKTYNELKDKRIIYDFILVEKEIKTAEDLVEVVNSQKSHSIRSLDVFSHGGPHSLYFNTGEETDDADTRQKHHNVSMYRGWRRREMRTGGYDGWIGGDWQWDGSALISRFKFTNFTRDAKVEFHGCGAAEAYTEPEDTKPVIRRTMFQGQGLPSYEVEIFSSDDNFAADMARRLYEAGKIESTVIGHMDNGGPKVFITENTPLIHASSQNQPKETIKPQSYPTDKNGNLKVPATHYPYQDYRCRDRIVYHKNRVIFKTSLYGHIDENSLVRQVKGSDR